MGGGGAVLAVAGVVQHQHAPVIGGGGRVLAQQLHPLVIDLLVVPGRLRQEPLQPLDLTVLGAGDRLDPGQPGQGLVAIPWQQQAVQIVTQAAALGQTREQGVESLGVSLQRTRRGRAAAAGGHRGSSLLAADWTMDRTAKAYPNLNKLPVSRSQVSLLSGGGLVGSGNARGRRPQVGSQDPGAAAHPRGRPDRTGGSSRGGRRGAGNNPGRGIWLVGQVPRRPAGRTAGKAGPWTAANPVRCTAWADSTDWSWATTRASYGSPLRCGPAPCSA